MADVDDGQQRDPYAERRMQLEQVFISLPPAGSAEYWAVLDQMVSLEVLSRCVRERLASSNRDDAEQVFGLMQRMLDRRLKVWAARTAATVPAAHGAGFHEDLQIGCYMALWEALNRPDPGFFVEHFPSALSSLESRVAHRMMEQQGYWKRKDVTTPNRVPPHMTDSLHATRPGDEGEDGLAIDVPDASADAAFEQPEQAEQTHALERTLASLTPEERSLLSDYYLRGLTHREIAEPQGLTPDAIRHRLKALLRRLRIELADTDERWQED